MKRFSLALFTVIVALALLVPQPVLASQSATLPPCSIYTLKNYREAEWVTQLTVGNFSAITLYADGQGKTGGQTNWVRLGDNEIRFIKDLNVASYKTWRWADSTMGTIYLGANWETDTTVRWPRIALASNEAGDRNRVCVLAYSADGKFARIAGIPKSSDYNQFKPYTWLFHVAYTVYPDMHTGAQALYVMPLFDPASGFTSSIGETGLWIRTLWLHMKVADFPGGTIASPPPPTPTPGAARVLVRAGTVVRQSPRGVKIYKAARDVWALMLGEVRGWIKIGEQRWIAVPAIR